MTAPQLSVREVTPAASLPALGSVPGVSRVAIDVARITEDFRDTAGAALLRQGLTLRRTSGESDEWILQGLPTGAELRRPATDSAEPPDEVLAAVRGQIRGGRLQSIATVESTRTAHRLLDDRGRLLLTVVDAVSSSHATLDAVAVLTSWRRWWVEPATGGDVPVATGGSAGKVTAQVEALLDRGGRRGATADPLARALGDRYPAPTAAPTPTRRGPAALVVQAHLTAQVEALAAQDWPVRTDAPDSVHQMRVATRRLRSALSTFGPLLDRAVTDPLRSELAWLAGVLGGARDAEVQRDHLAAVLAAEPVELVIGPVRAELDEHFARTYATAREAVLAALDDRRYFRLRDALDTLAAGAPFTAEAQGPAEKVATARVGAAFRRLKRAVETMQEQAARAGTPQIGSPVIATKGPDELFHETRKAAKRLRYAAQALAPAFGKPAVALAEAAENLQEILGDHQDSVVLRATLRDLAVRSFLDGGNPFTLGRLHALEQVRAERAEAAFAPAWADLDHKKLRRWLS
ncbi:CHAD domain-containing protein [Nakamurella flavida]|uniref:CHAD domain-containing protein n=1 Tax=Nakamurella flavida TaxID=363630 RepID=A0A938YNE7_9ACTN|nr:CHAD domain-containing protein [Nakamurella flavida]MBM9476419.1 CHAD domain-containing protein [Nakamurella flavida]MDP9779480.1 CHAD domain-containing protein [Nakamurella flavida]